MKRSSAKTMCNACVNSAEDKRSAVHGYLKGKSSLMIFNRHAILKYKYETGISGAGDTM